MATHFSVLGWEILWTERLASCSPWDVAKELDTTKTTVGQLLKQQHDNKE